MIKITAEDAYNIMKKGGVIAVFANRFRQRKIINGKLYLKENQNDTWHPYYKGMGYWRKVSTGATYTIISHPEFVVTESLPQLSFE